MFQIVYTPRHRSTHYGNYDSLQGVILAARENGALIFQWDNQSRTWREV